MQINIKLMDGKSTVVEVLKKDTVRNVKTKINEKIGVNPIYMKLVFEGSVMDDDHTMEDCGVYAQCTLILIHKVFRDSMSIFLKAMDGKTYELEISKLLHIRDLKILIAEKLGCENLNFKLIYQGTTMELDRTIEEYHVSDKSVLNVAGSLYSGWHDIFRQLDGRLLDTCCKCFCKIKSAKDTIADRTGVKSHNLELLCDSLILEDDVIYNRESEFPIYLSRKFTGDIKICVKTTDGKCWKTETSRQETVGELKVKIAELSGIKFEVMKLKHENLFLDEDSTMEMCEITTNSEILVISQSTLRLKICVRMMNGESCTVEVMPHETIHDLTQRIKRKLRLTEKGEFKLIYKGARLPSNASVEEYGLTDESVVHFVPIRDVVRVFVRTMDARIMTLETSLQDRVEILKLKIVMQSSMGLSLDQVRLADARETLDNERTLEESGIRANSVIYLFRELPADVPILVKINSAKTLHLKIGSQETIEYLELVLREKKEISVVHPTFTYKGSILNKNDTIEKCGILPRSTLYLDDDCSLTRLRINSKLREPFFLSISYFQTIRDLQSIISEVLDIEIEKMTLKYEGKILNEELKIKDGHIFYETDVVVVND